MVRTRPALRHRIGEIAGRLVGVAAEQLIEEAARRARGGAVLRAAIVLRQRQHHRAALLAAVDVAAAQALQVHIDAVEIAAHARDLPGEIDALLRRALPPPNRKKPVPSQPWRRLCADHAVELALLAARRLLVAAHLLGARRIAAGAAVDRGELAFEARADLGG